MSRLDRTFKAPATLVWRAWTDPDLVPRWYGPGVTSIVHKMDVRTGGVWLHEMRWGDTAHFQRIEYTAVEQPTRLAWLHHTANAVWETAANPQMPTWPRIIDTEVTLTEANGETALQMTWAPHRATPEETQTFQSSVGGMSKGWNKGMDLLEGILAELQA